MIFYMKIEHIGTQKMWFKDTVKTGIRIGFKISDFRSH